MTSSGLTRLVYPTWVFLTEAMPCWKKGLQEGKKAMDLITLLCCVNEWDEKWPLLVIRKSKFPIVSLRSSQRCLCSTETQPMHEWQVCCWLKNWSRELRLQDLTMPLIWQLPSSFSKCRAITYHVKILAPKHNLCEVANGRGCHEKLQRSLPCLS